MPSKKSSSYGTVIVPIPILIGNVSESVSFVLDDDFPQNRRAFYEARVSKRGLISKDLALLAVPSDSVHTVHK